LNATRLPGWAFLGVSILGLAWPVSLAAAMTPTPTTLLLVVQPTATPPVFGVPPSRTPTPPSSGVQTRTPTPTQTSTPTASPTTGSFAIPTFTPTAEFGGELLPTVTPHWDPYYTPEFPLTLPSPTPTPQTFKGPDVPDLWVRAVEVTQGMQNFENDMPLVENRATVARVYVCADPVAWPDVRAGLQAWRDGLPLSPGPGKPAGMALSPANGPITAQVDCGNRLDLDDSLYFVLPQDWLHGVVTLRAYVYAADPQAPMLFEPFDANNFKTVPDLEFHPAETARFRFIPLHLHEGFDKDNTSATFFPTEVTFGLQGGWDIAHDLFRLHPIAEMLVELAGESVSPAFHSFGDEWELDDSDKYGKPLDRLQYYRDWEDNAPWYVGMVSPTLLDDAEPYLGLARMDKGVSWVIMDPSHWNATRWHIGGGSTLGHELGHLADLKHAPCADSDGDGKPDEDNVDGNFPTGFPNCSLAPVDPEGFYGFDVTWELWPYTDGPTVISNDPGAAQPHRGSPLMGYGSPSYIDAYHYCLLLQHYGVDCNPGLLGLGGEGPGGGVGPKADCDTADNPFPGPLVNWELCLTSAGEPEYYHPETATSVVIVSGSVDPQANVATIDEVLRVADPPAGLLEEMTQRRLAMIQQGQTSPFHLSLEAIDGTLAVLMPLVDSTTYHRPVGRISFSEILPDVTGASVVRIRRGGTMLAERASSASAPEVAFVAEPVEPTAPPFDLRWTASDADGDTLTFTLLHRPHPEAPWRVLADREFAIETTADGPVYRFTVGQETWIRGSTRGQFRIVAADGYHTATDDSAPVYDLPNRPPLALIVSPADGLVVPVNAVLLLKAVASDLEDRLLSPDRLHWSSDRDGSLGSGSLLVLRDLSPGVHSITLTATDSSGLDDIAVARVAVDPAVVQWVPDDEEQAALDAVLAAAAGPGGPAEAAPVRGFAQPILLAAALLAGVVGAVLLVLALRPRLR